MTRRPRSPGRAAVIAAMALVASSAFAQPVLGDRGESRPASPVAAEIDALLAALDAPDFRERDAATRRMAELATMDDSAIAALMQRPGLTLEQQFRVVRVIRERFMSTPRGAIGVQFSSTAPRPVVGVMLGGFPAERQGVLKPGDILLEVDGVDLSMDSAWTASRHSLYRIQSLIHSRDPGDLLPAKILRPAPGGAGVVRLEQGHVAVQLPKGDELEVMIPLGREEDLRRQAGEPANARREAMNAAWFVRAQRLGLLNQANSAEIAQTPPRDQWEPYINLTYLGQSAAMMTPGPLRAGVERGDGHRLAMTVLNQVNEARWRQQQVLRQRMGANANMINGDDPGSFGRILPDDVSITSESEEGLIGGSDPLRARQDDPASRLARLERLRNEMRRLEAHAAASDGVAERRAFEDAITQLRDRILIAERDVTMILRSPASAAAQP